ncbi:MAG: hypothetical protein NVSMB14_08060 [Isosphaeraceae bacterium]
MIKIPGRMPAALALAVVLFAPSFTQAQQLFPNAPIRVRRQRPSCAEEPPYYKFVRQQYYGYFPTCWRKWPTGWQCPCGHPEPPDLERALRERPLELSKTRTDDGVDAPAEGMDNSEKSIELRRDPKNILPDDDMGPVNPPPPARGGRLDNVPPINPNNRDNPGNPVVPGAPGNPAARLNEPRASVDDSNATVAAGDAPELPPVSLANDESPGSIDPVPSPSASEASPQPSIAPPAGTIPVRPAARPGQRRGFLSALIGRIRRG